MGILLSISGVMYFTRESEVGGVSEREGKELWNGFPFPEFRSFVTRSGGGGIVGWGELLRRPRVLSLHLWVQGG